MQRDRGSPSVGIPHHAASAGLVQIALVAAAAALTGLAAGVVRARSLDGRRGR